VPGPTTRAVRLRPLIAAVLVCLVAAAALLVLATWPRLQVLTSAHGTVQLGRDTVAVTIADTPDRRDYGLQGRSSLADGSGMLFIFDPAQPVLFARKTVPFPIDVIFVRADERVAAVLPLDAGHQFAASPGDVRWVVEVPGGWARRSSVTTGSAFTPPR
jgi:uncharacterized membrane protein (UPF0127 family)